MSAAVKRVGVLVAATIALMAAAAGQSSAATLAPTAGINMTSVSLNGSDVYWFQRTMRDFNFPPRIPGTIAPIPAEASQRGSRVEFDAGGRVLHREIGSPTVSVVFKPTDGLSIVGFAARGGRVVVGLSSDEERARTSLVELIRTGTGWTEKVLLSRVGGEQGGVCDSRVRLVNVDSTGGVVYSEETVDGRNGKCDLVRVSTAFKRLAPDGVTTDLHITKSGWAVEQADVEEFSLRAGPGAWYARSEGGDTFFGALNVETGRTSQAPMMVSSAGRLEITKDGRVLRQAFTEQKRRFFILNRTPENFSDRVNFQRGGHTTWFHICGEKVLEISRKRKPRKRGGGRFWYLHVRNFDAVVERQLPAKLPRGTVFNGCDAETALFSRTVRKGRVRQVAVPLGG